jgi:LemA protein
VNGALLFGGGAVLAVLLVWVAAVFNGLVRRRNRVDATWSDVDVLLRRRHDLVPGLVASVQGYAGHESATLRDVAEARASAIAAQGPGSAGAAEAQLALGVRSLLAVAEAYPQLKASALFIDLQERLTATEDGIEHARQFYNDAVYGYNTAVQTLPGALVAGPLGLHRREFFQASPADQGAVTVRP